MLNENAPPDCPKAEVEPNRLGVLLAAAKLPPKRLGVLMAPKAGVLEAPKRPVPDEAPKAGVLEPNKEGVLAAGKNLSGACRGLRKSQCPSLAVICIAHIRHSELKSHQARQSQKRCLQTSLGSSWSSHQN